MPNPDGSPTYTEQQAAERNGAEAKYMADYNAWKQRAAMESHGGPPAGPKPVYGGATNLVEPNSATAGAGNGNTDLSHSYASPEAYASGAPPATAFNNGTLDEHPLIPASSDPTGGAAAPLTPQDSGAFPGATVDTGPQADVRRQQQEYLDALKARAEGRAPSVAAAQYSLAQGDIARSAAGIAAQARGVDAAAARRTAMLSGGDQTQQAALRAALLRATETTQATDQQRAALSGVRTQDQALAEKQADLTQDTQKTKFSEGGVNARYEAMLRDQAAARAAQERNTRYAADRAQGNTVLGGLLGGAATVGAAYMTSDVRAKTDIRAESGADMSGFLDSLRPYAYRYRDPEADGAGERHGPMAQDLERSAIGRSVVHTGPDGVKRVDTGALTLALAGAVGRMAKERRGRAA